MLLTGKALEDFLIRIYYTEDTNQASDESDKQKIFFHSTKWLEIQDERFVNSLIVDWLDSVKYTENTSLWNHCFCISYWNRGMKEFKESIEQAIIKANEIYNDNNR